MKVSVVVPVYNEQLFIKRCLENILSQNVKADEVIIVDNNCTDKTCEIAKEMGARVVREKRQGMIYARNKGFESAKYEIIARTDADSIVPRNWIEKIKYNFRTQNIDALSGPIVFDTKVKTSAPALIYSRSLKKFLKGNYVLQGPHMALTKVMWKKVRPYVNLDDSKVHEDVDLSMNIIKMNGKIGYDESLIVETSARRMKKKPLSFFIEYPIRLVRTFRANR
jgi:glycosyltransferase involved in cell wall biosynthesis